MYSKYLICSLLVLNQINKQVWSTGASMHPSTISTFISARYFFLKSLDLYWMIREMGKIYWNVPYLWNYRCWFHGFALNFAHKIVKNGTIWFPKFLLPVTSGYRETATVSSDLECFNRWYFSVYKDLKIISTPSFYGYKKRNLLPIKCVSKIIL